MRLEAGETVTLDFILHTDELSFFGRDMRETVEPGQFHVWIGGSSDTHLRTEFRIIAID
jgi:beta-glucosidase